MGTFFIKNSHYDVKTDSQPDLSLRDGDRLQQMKPVFSAVHLSPFLYLFSMSTYVH